jgi:hypothetical protein
MSDYTIVVESRENSKAKKIRNEYEHMHEAMNKVYEVIHHNPNGIVSIHREWDFGRKSDG